MSLVFKVDSLDGVEESARGFYRPSEDGKFELDVSGAVSDAKYAEMEEKYKAARSDSMSPEGKLYRTMFDGSQNALKEARSERDGFRNELKAWKELGSVEEIKGKFDELDSLRRDGKKLGSVEQELINLKQSERTLKGEIEKLNTANENLRQDNESLAAYKKEAERKADFYDVDERITKVVEGIREANQKALKRNLLDRYKDGDLKRSENGSLVSSDEKALSLEEYARETMEAYGLFTRSTPGVNVPSGNPPRGVSGSRGGYAGMADLLH